jgi:starch synthase
VTCFCFRLRYGAVPVVRSTGGLADIVTDFDPENTIGNGFTFHTYNKLSLFGAIIRAIQVYRNKKVWTNLMKRVMKEDVSWEKAARQYMDLYARAIEFRRDRQSPLASVTKRIE